MEHIFSCLLQENWTLLIAIVRSMWSLYPSVQTLIGSECICHESRVFHELSALTILPYLPFLCFNLGKIICGMYKIVGFQYEIIEQ